MGWRPRQSGSPTSRLTCHAYPLCPGSQPVCAKAMSYPESRARWEGRNRVPRELRSEEVVPRSHQSLKEEQATPMWRASSSAWPLSPVQRGESHTRPPPSPQSLALLWEGAILRARSWIMSHSGCYGPLSGLGHHILANAAGPSQNSITAPRTTWRQRKSTSLSQSTRDSRLPAREGGQVSPLTSLPSHQCLIPFVKLVAKPQGVRNLPGADVVSPWQQHILEGGRRIAPAS